MVNNEQCDDGNTINYDGCSSTCTIETCDVTCNCGGYSYPRVGLTCTTICGDGIVVGSEQCDDANAQSNDGCSSSCKVEASCNLNCSCAGWYPPFVNGTCSTICGDGMMQGAETCDDGNLVSSDGCSANCTK